MRHLIFLKAAISLWRKAACRISGSGVVTIGTSSRMRIFTFNILVFLFNFVGHYTTFALQDVTTDLFGDQNHGTVAAFGDFNSDKQTDIFVIRERMLLFFITLLLVITQPLGKLCIESLNVRINCNFGVSGFKFSHQGSTGNTLRLYLWGLFVVT